MFNRRVWKQSECLYGVDDTDCEDIKLVINLEVEAKNNFIMTLWT